MAYYHSPKSSKILFFTCYGWIFWCVFVKTFLLLGKDSSHELFIGWYKSLVLFAWNVNDAANYDCHRETFDVFKCIRLSNISTRISMEKIIYKRKFKERIQKSNLKWKRYTSISHRILYKNAYWKLISYFSRSWIP